MQDKLKDIINKPTNGVAENPGPSIIFIGFADNKIPEFKESKSKDWILFGSDNKFPEQLLYLFNKSSNHNAIINGKVTYIMGKGFESNVVVNRYGETVNKVYKKFCTDIELFGGGRFEVIWKMGGAAELIHIPFQCLRKSKDGKGYWYRKTWADLKRDDEPRFVPNFDIKEPQGAQIFAYNEYRPGCDHYPLPTYFGALNDIETDVEISKYNLSVIKQGMFSSKMIVFNTGDPGEDAKRKIEKGFRDKFAGSDNAGRFMLVFNTDPQKTPIVNDLSTTDLDKLFDQLNKTTQAEIFSGHQVTSPMLFGIMEPGKLGGRNELQDAFEIFKNTYVNDKQMAIEEVHATLAKITGAAPGKLIPIEPLTLALNPVDFKDSLPIEWIFEKIGIDITKYPPKQPGGVIETTPANDNIRNLSGKQHQQVMRIIRQYSQGKIEKNIAITMLRTGYGLLDSDINTMLGIEEFSASYTEIETAEMFAQFGEQKEKFTIVKQRMTFESEEQAFADITKNDSSIINLIGKDKRITPEIIAQTIKESVDYVRARIKSLEEKGVLTRTQTVIGIDTIIEHAINPEQIDNRPPPETVDIYIKYSYEPKPGLEPVIETTRPFCKRLIELDRLYTRSEIESISQRVGFSVWDRKGGWWGDKPECRHRWFRNVVIKKR